jgi:tetratricopeptide (TPR) repeat protein
MPMRARFLSPSTLAYLLTASFLLIATTSTFARPTAEADAEGQSANLPVASNSQIDPREWFAKGQAALQAGDLAAAEAAFRKVLVADPRAGSAYANLGVIAMRRKDWDRAILLLRKAEKLEPKMAGIRLNLGIVEYRRGNYAAAIAPLSSVLRDQPDSQQARYLLGLCQVFTKKFAEAVTVLEPLWSEKSNDVLYLYLYDIAAVESGQKELDEKILSRMVAVGDGTPEFHLIMGKAFLNRFEVAEGKAELELAAAGNPDLPYLHLNLGITYMRMGDNERAEAEFRRDIALEPDLADNYEQLGVLYSRMQRDEDAEKSFLEALKRDAKSAGSYLGLAKLYQKQNKPEPGLKMIDTALRLSPDIHGGHFLRGRILTQLGRGAEARVEYAAAQKGMQGKLDKERESREEERVPNPELTRQPQP